MPNDIKIILYECGYNSWLSISVLKEQDLVQIETYLCSKRDKLQLLKDYTFEEQFKLLPGHRTLILGLASRVQEYLNHVKEQSQLESKAKQPRINKTVTKSDDELKIELTKKLTNFLKKLNYSIEFEIEKDISEFKKEGNSYRCKVRCPFCDKQISCLFSSHCAVSNLELHLKTHISNIPTVQSILPGTSSNETVTDSSTDLVNEHNLNSSTLQ